MYGDVRSAIATYLYYSAVSCEPRYNRMRQARDHFSVTSHTRVGQGAPMKDGLLQESTGLYLVTGKVLAN